MSSQANGCNNKKCEIYTTIRLTLMLMVLNNKNMASAFTTSASSEHFWNHALMHFSNLYKLLAYTSLHDGPRGW